MPGLEGLPRDTLRASLILPEGSRGELLKSECAGELREEKTRRKRRRRRALERRPIKQVCEGEGKTGGDELIQKRGIKDVCADDGGTEIVGMTERERKESSVQVMM